MKFQKIKSGDNTVFLLLLFLKQYFYLRLFFEVHQKVKKTIKCYSKEEQEVR